MAEQQGVQSIEVGMVLLRALGRAVIHGEASAEDIAAAIEARCR